MNLPLSEDEVASIMKTLANAEERSRKWGSQDISSFRSPATLQAALRGPHSPSEREQLYEALRKLAAVYLDAPPAGRAEIRAIFNEAENTRRGLPSVGEKLANTVGSADGAETIRLALALVSINDLKSDSRDVQVAVGGIVAAARQRGWIHDLYSMASR